MNKVILSAISLFVITALIIGCFTKKTANNSPKSVAVTYTVKSDVYENIIEIAGTVEAADEQKLQALSDGTVLGVYVKKGDRVKKDATIIQLDATEQEYNLARLDYQIASTKITGSAREIDLLYKQRLSLLQRIEDRKVKATFSGIIADLNVAVGDSLEAKDSCGTLVNIDYLIAEVEIPETDVSSLKVGQKVEFSFPAYKGVVIGHVISWPAIGEVTSRGATVVKAKIRIDDYPKEILPNYSFTGKIVITEPEDVFFVEREAVGKDPNGTFVELVDTNERIYVKVAPYARGFLKIEEGIRDGVALKAQKTPTPSGTKKKSQSNNGNNGKNAGGKNKGGPMGGPPPR